MARERKLTKWILIRQSGQYRTMAEAARSLGVARNTLYRALKDFHIPIETFLVPIGTLNEHADTPQSGPKSHPPTIPMRDDTPPAKHNHVADPTHFGIAASQRRGFELWRSYAPKRKPWER